MKKTALTATAIARMAGCSRSTVRNYSRSGLLNPIILNDRTRVFEPDDVDRLRAAMGSRKGKSEGEGGSR